MYFRDLTEKAKELRELLDEFDVIRIDIDSDRRISVLLNVKDLKENFPFYTLEPVAKGDPFNDFRLKTEYRNVEFVAYGKGAELVE